MSWNKAVKYVKNKDKKNTKAKLEAATAPAEQDQKESQGLLPEAD